MKPWKQGNMVSFQKDSKDKNDIGVPSYFCWKFLHGFSSFSVITTLVLGVKGFLLVYHWWILALMYLNLYELSLTHLEKKVGENVNKK